MRCSRNAVTLSGCAAQGTRHSVSQVAQLKERATRGTHAAQGTQPRGRGAVVRQTWVLDADAPQVQLVALVYTLHEGSWNVTEVVAHAEIVLLASQ